MAARFKVIILDQDPVDSNNYRFVMWADVPAARQSFYANATAKSAWIGALAVDITALQNGSVVETVVTQRVPSTSTLAQIEAFLQTQWNAYQTQITNFNPWIHYGSTWDGTTWTVATNG